ncbi:MAG TPA: hypothetical protein VGL27_12605 [Negativicutes bacterium]|jgi:hypothetical protein
MQNYVLYNWNAQLRWAEISGVYFVDPHHLAEFLATFTNARELPLHANIV